MEDGDGRSLGLFRPKVDKRKKKKIPIQSSPVSPIQLQSLPGLVEEDVSRLRVLGDV